MIPDYFASEPCEYLRIELGFRQRRNPSYSIRAFARDLEVSPSHLSEFLSGKASLSWKKLGEIAKVLRLSPEQKEHWQDLLEMRSKEPAVRRKAKLRVQKRIKDSRSHVSLEVFKVISDWQYFALLAFFGVSPSWSVQELSGQLRLPEEDIRRAMKTLVKVGLLEKTDEGLQPVANSSFAGDQVPSEAVRESHRQVLGKAVEALDLFGTEERMSQSFFFSLPRKNIASFRDALKVRVLETLSEFSEETQDRDKDSVLALTWHLFPIQGKEINR